MELQKLSGEDRGAVLSGSKSGTDEFDDSDLTPLSDEEVVMTTPQQKRKVLLAFICSYFLADKLH